MSTYEIMVRMFCNEERLDMAMGIWDEMKRKGILPGMHMFSTLICALCHESKLDEACKYFQEMLDVGIRPLAKMFSTLKEALVHARMENTAIYFALQIDKLRKSPANLAGATLANSWFSVTGMAIMIQSVEMPLIVLSILPLLIHIGIAYALVQWPILSFTEVQADMASIFNAVIPLHIYKHETSSALCGNGRITTSLIAICANTEFIAYPITYGLGAAASTCVEKLKLNLNSTRVSNELGAGNPERAKHAMNVTLKLSLLLGYRFILALGFGHNVWIQLFSDSPTIEREFASVTPLLAISILLDAVQGVLSGFMDWSGLWVTLSNCDTLPFQKACQMD
ncbi:hypothetical protein Fmac_018995 [Flemingia macrophylla]|uniref:Uncharacterized protein n=1 Tax=Flemingia macrophylla TaxID=520843 RepID=A0ABD1M6L2_9FABA